MIKSIHFDNYQDIANCRSLLFQSRESFLKCSFTLFAGKSYGVISDFGCGGWGLITSLAGRGSGNYSGNIYVNEKASSPSELSLYSCFVTESVFPSINSKNNLLSPKECISKALIISEQPYSVADIKDIFHLSNERFERSLDSVSGEIWQISLAINFSLGKIIYCYPWLNEIDISWFEIAFKSGIIDFLKKQGKIILIPSSQNKTLKRICDHTMKFHHGMFTFR